MYDEFKDGWEGTAIKFTQGSTVQIFGSVFTDGEELNESVTFSSGIPVSVGVDKVGSNSDEVGFAFRDEYNNVVYKYRWGSTLVAGANLGTFCPNCGATSSGPTNKKKKA